MQKCLLIISLILSLSSFAQDLKMSKVDTLDFITDEIDILAPSKAAFYSAVLPGLGQIYNKKYWKTPIVWAALGTSIFFYVDNDKFYTRYRAAFKNRLAGRPDEFDGNSDAVFLSQSALERAQNVYKKNRDLSLFISIGIYILNIVEANVDAHLPDKALNTNISFTPEIFMSPITNEALFGASLKFKF